jgi:hypothetical protein
VLNGSETIFIGASNRFRSGLVELLCEPFRFRRTKGMESSNVDEIRIFRRRFGRSRCNERHQSGFRRIQAV